MRLPLYTHIGLYDYIPANPLIFIIFSHNDADPCALPEEFGLGDDVAQRDTRRRTFFGLQLKRLEFFRHNKRGVELYTIITVQLYTCFAI